MTTTFAYACFFALSIAAVLSAPWAFAMVMLMYPIEQLLQSSGGPFLTFPWLGNVITAACVGVTVLRLIAKEPVIIKGYANPQWMIAIVLVLWSLASLAWSPSRESALQIINSWYPFVVLFILAGSLLIYDLASLQRACTAFFISGVLLALLISTSSDFRSTSGRLVTSLGAGQTTNPLMIGEFGGNLLICSLLLHYGRGNLLMTAMRGVGFLLGSVLTLESGSRGQLVFAIALCVLFFPVARKIRTVGNFLVGAALLLVSATAFAFIAPIYLQGYSATRWDSGILESSFMGRLQNISDLLSALATNPLAWGLGLGYNAFSSVGQNKVDVYSHNLSAEIIGELGIPMFLLYVAMLWRACRDGSHLIRDNENDPETRAAIGVLLAMTAYQFTLAQKQGTLWACGGLLMLIIIINGLQRRNAVDTEALPNSGT